MQSIIYFFRLLAIIFGTLIALRIVFIMINRVPSVVVALSAASIVVFAVAYRRGSMQSIGIRSRRASVIAASIAFILLIISTIILINVK